jgi:hypothetical protein
LYTVNDSAAYGLDRPQIFRAATRQRAAVAQILNGRLVGRFHQIGAGNTAGLMRANLPAPRHGAQTSAATTFRR